MRLSWAGFGLAFAMFCAWGASAAAQSEAIVRTTPRADGSAIEWRMYGRTDAPAQGVIVIAQGSGCGPAAQNPNLQLARAIAPGFVAIVAEKYGVSGDAAPEEACSQAFYDGFTLSQRIEDYQRVLAVLRREPWWSGELVMMGGSEGSAAMAVLGARERDVDAVVLLSSGGGWSLRRILVDEAPPSLRAERATLFARARAEPQSSELALGHSFRFWADCMDREFVNDMLEIDAPVLLIQGEADTSTPVGSARATRDAFAAAERRNLTYWEEPGYDHAMTDRGGVNHMAEVFERARVWVAAQLR